VQVAALADIHGNIQALDAVLADPRLPEQVLVLGDVVAGTFPTECYDRLAELGERARISAGTPTGSCWSAPVKRPSGSTAASARSGSRWPLSFSVSVAGLGDVRCCHATPRDDDEIVTKLTSDETVAGLLEETKEATVIGGHTHMQLDRPIGRWRFVNVGSVGRPYEGRPGAYWALLGPEVELVRTDLRRPGGGRGDLAFRPAARARGRRHALQSAISGWRCCRIRIDARWLRWAIVDSNHGPPPYQSGALTN
jgi:predicted phosphodiesterase